MSISSNRENRQLGEEAVHIGEVSGTHGVRGELRIYHLSHQPDLLRGVRVFVIDGQEYSLISFRTHKHHIIAKLLGLENRTAAEALIGLGVYIYKPDLPRLEPSNYFVEDIIGFDIVENNGNKLGLLKDVEINPNCDLLVVDYGGREVLIPMSDVFVEEIDSIARTITVNLPEGMLDL